MNARHRARPAPVTLLALVALFAAGCGESYTAAPLDSSRARDALKTTLDAWKKGDTIESLKAGNPSITAQDLDWQTGARLVDYQIDGDGKGIDSNLKVPVKLTMKTKDDKDVVKTVNYLVSTSPAITVFRDFR